MIQSLVIAALLAINTSIGTLPVNKGYIGCAGINFNEDVSTAIMTLRVYKVPPANGRGGVLLFPAKTLLPILGLPTWQCVPLSATDTAVPTTGTLYAELDVRKAGGTNEAQLMGFSIAGR